MTFKIDKGVPIPESLARYKTKYPWAAMQPGDSFTIDIGDRNPEVAQNRLANAARMRFGKGNIRTAREGEKIRVWRIA